MSARGSHGLPKRKETAVKVIVVGDQGVGKTCVISRYTKQSFESHEAPTVAPSYKAMTVTNTNGAPLTLHLWDTAGQERYQSVSKFFYRGADIAIICFACNEQSSLKNVTKWADVLKQECSTCKPILAMTKCDILKPEVAANMRQEMKAMEGAIGALGSFETSALANTGIKELFQGVVCVYDGKSLDEYPSEVAMKKSKTKKKSRC